MQDDYAIQSFERSIAARDSGAFEWEIAPVRLLMLLNGRKLLDSFCQHYNHSLSQIFQVEVPGPRGRPSTIVDKDDDLAKVTCHNYAIYNIC